MTHTPGPWRDITEDQAFHVFWQKAIDDAGSFSHLSKPQIDAIAADARRKARLIATAPDLLAALKEIVRRADDDKWRRIDSERLDAARAAIAKATGE